MLELSLPALVTAYAELAERHLDAANILLNEGHHDSAVFHSCHAFECICRSGLLSFGDKVSRAPGGHKTNLDRFLNGSRARRRRFREAANAVAGNVKVFRDPALYPDSRGSPYQHFTPKDAGDMWSRVRGIVRDIRNDLNI